MAANLCVVCSKLCTVSENMTYTAPCGHRIHNNCALTLETPSCPSCERGLPTCLYEITSPSWSIKMRVVPRVVEAKILCYLIANARAISGAPIILHPDSAYVRCAAVGEGNDPLYWAQVFVLADIPQFILATGDRYRDFDHGAFEAARKMAFPHSYRLENCRSLVLRLPATFYDGPTCEERQTKERDVNAWVTWESPERRVLQLERPVCAGIYDRAGPCEKSRFLVLKATGQVSSPAANYVDALYGEASLCGSLLPLFTHFHLKWTMGEDASRCDPAAREVDAPRPFCELSSDFVPRRLNWVGTGDHATLALSVYAGAAQ